jgi:hypothetical protein
MLSYLAVDYLQTRLLVVNEIDIHAIHSKDCWNMPLFNDTKDLHGGGIKHQVIIKNMADIHTH